MKATYDDAINAIRTLKGSGFDAYLAGGCVRDLLLHCEPNDYDVTTSATPEEVTALFSYTIPVGASFGVVKVIYGENRELDIATFRTDGTYTDNRRPDNVAYTRSAQEDVKRRDFTINAMLMDEHRNLIDYVGGLEDLENRVLRTVGTAGDRFREDALRMMRAIRFAVRFNMVIDPATWEAIKANVSTIKNISKERVTDEMTKMFSYGRCDIAFWLMRKSGLWRKWMAPYQGDDGDAFRAMFGLGLVDAGDPFILPLAILSYQMHEPQKIGLAKRFCLTTDQRRDLTQLMKHTSELSGFMKAQLCDQRRQMFYSDARLAAKLMYCLQPQQVEQYELEDDQTIASVVIKMAEVKMMGFPDALVNGNDLIGMGYIAGPVFTKMLSSIQDAQLNGELQAEGVDAFLEANFPAAARKLPDGTVRDGMGPFRMIAKCKKCGQQLSYEMSFDEMGNKKWGSVCNVIGLRSTSMHDFFYECSKCGTKRAKNSFVKPVL